MEGLFHLLKQAAQHLKTALDLLAENAEGAEEKVREAYFLVLEAADEVLLAEGGEVLEW